MAAECHSRFGLSFQRKLTLAFDGGEITSDAGLLLVREFDERLGLTAVLRAAAPDPRDRRYVTHDVVTLLRQRIYQIAAGYEDANAHGDHFHRVCPRGHRWVERCSADAERGVGRE